jgi:nitrite reductase (cytochrome c-552)
MRNLKKDPNYDPNKHATRQEMRTYVCGQCHVEYYFKGKEKRLTYPWHNGLKGDQILEYYETQTDHADWTHKESGAKVLKAQHPEFELYSQGVHALACHRRDEAELRARVETIQERHMQMRNTAMDALMALIADIKAAGAGGASQAQLDEARKYQKRAQFLLDFIEAENSSGFHASQEAARLMVLSVDHSRKGELALRGVNPGAAPLPQPVTPQLPAAAAPAATK